MTSKISPNQDPVTDPADAHPVGTGVGAAGGALAGAAVGTTMAGPVGTVAGAVVGAIAGGLAGQGIARVVNPKAEDAYWRENYNRSPDYVDGYTYDDYAPAYRQGYEGYSRYNGSSFDANESTLRDEWERAKGNSRLTWEQAKGATRSAWHRVERALPGDADGDGR